MLRCFVVYSIFLHLLMLPLGPQIFLKLVDFLETKQYIAGGFTKGSWNYIILKQGYVIQFPSEHVKRRDHQSKTFQRVKYRSQNIIPTDRSNNRKRVFTLLQKSYSVWTCFGLQTAEGTNWFCPCDQCEHELLRCSSSTLCSITLFAA